jgi:hypothetical protein
VLVDAADGETLTEVWGPGTGAGWQAADSNTSANASRPPATSAQLSSFKKLAILSYSTLRCSGSDGSSRSWLMSRVCSSTHSCQQSPHVWTRTIEPHLPGSGAWDRVGLGWPQRRQATSVTQIARVSDVFYRLGKRT